MTDTKKGWRVQWLKYNKQDEHSSPNGKEYNNNTTSKQFQYSKFKKTKKT